MDKKKIVCEYCKEKGIHTTFSWKQSYYKHRVKNHPELYEDPKDSKLKVLEMRLKDTEKALAEMSNNSASILKAVNDIRDKVQTPSNVTNNNNITQINNTINVYFNKDLKYYPELVKLLGRQKTCNYLLFKMPESKDLFGVLDKIFVKDGISTCPIRVDDDDEFIVARNDGEYVHDPTGELIDRENKSKLQDAILSAYIDSTKHLDEECDKIRQTRVNGEYTEQDMETINKRFDSAIEPSRPYEVIDIMNGIKPKKKDFDRLRKICPKVVKKIVN